LIGADDLAKLSSAQKDELFAALYLHRSELRLVAFNDHGQIRGEDPALNAILKLSNARFVSETSYAASAKYGIPKGVNVLLIKDAARYAPRAEIRAVLLKERAGEIEFARRLAMNGGFLPEAKEGNGIIDAPDSVFAELARSKLRLRVIAYAA